MVLTVKLPSKAVQTKLEKLAVEVRTFLLDRGMWIDTRVYFNGRCFNSCPTDESFKGGYSFYNNAERLDVIEYIDPRSCFEYVNEKLMFAMSFEGPLYEALNYGGTYGWKVEEELRAIFTKYGFYYELGHAWNLSIFEN